MCKITFGRILRRLDIVYVVSFKIALISKLMFEKWYGS